MATQTRSPATVTEQDPSGQPWVNPNNVKVSDNQYAVGSYAFLEHMKALLCEGFGFTLPAGATVNSIVVHSEQISVSLNTRTIPVVWKGAVEGGFGTGIVGEVDVEETLNITSGLSGPLWGLTWTATEINDDFKVYVQFDDAFDESGNLSIDRLSATVDYTEGGEPPQTIRPDADIVTTGWATAPLWSKIEEASADGTVISGTAS